MDDTKTSTPSINNPTDKNYKKKRVEEIGSALAQIKARVKANRSCARKDDESKSSPREILSEKSEKYIQVLQLDKAKAQKLEKERPKIKEAIENLMIDRENQKLVEKKIEETRAKQSAPLPEIPVEVQKRISDLELTIHNLKETLSEKERVLESKSESWRLLSDQMEQRNIEVVDRYEMMAREIEEVKRNYGEQETFLKQELDKCKQKLDHTDSLLISRDNEKLEWDEMKAELQQLQDSHSQCESKMEAEKKLCLKLKAQLKKMRNEVNSNKGLSDEVERLKNVIAGLEEEKGNHLLQLIDFDEYKDAAVKNMDVVTELTDKLKLVERDYTNLKQEYLFREKEKEDLSNVLSEKEEIIAGLRQSLEVMEQHKISAEFKAAELEEKLEAEGSDKMTKEVDNLACHAREQDALVEELRVTLQSRDDELKVLRDGKVDDLRDLLEEWKEKYTRVENSMSSMEQERLGLTAKIEDLQSELLEMTKKCESLNHELKNSETLLEQQVIKNQELTESLARSGSKPGEDQTPKLKKLAANLKIKIKLCKELEEKVAELTNNVSGHENTIAELQKEKTELEMLVSEYKSKLENVSLDSDVVNELQRLLNDKEATIKRLSEQQNVLQRARTQSHGEIQQLKEENLLLESRLNENLMEIHCVDEDRNSEQLMQSLTSKLEEKTRALTDLETTASELREQLKQIEYIEVERKAAMDEQADTIDRLKKDIIALQTNQGDISSYATEKESLTQQIRDLEAELLQYTTDISNKEVIISNFEHEMNLLKSEINLNESQLVKMEVFFKEEESKRDGVMANIELDLVTSKNEIYRLCEELSEVSRNYDQCMDNLKLKDHYIDGLETELGNFKAKVLTLEDTIDEKQRFIEERAAKLGEKLDEAALRNSDFEHYRIEAEQRIKLYEHSEKQLTDKILEVQEELKEVKTTNDQLVEERKSAKNRVQELELELTDIKEAYCTTLDQIELLNGELKQVMDQIEHRNRELVRVGEERNRLIVRLGELEGTCTELQTQLRGYEEQSTGLRIELDSKLKELDSATAEITNLQSQLDTGILSTDLNKELEELRMGYEERLRELQVEKNDLLKVLRGSVEPELDSVVEAAVHKVVEKQNSEEKEAKEEEVKMFSWDAHAEAPADSQAEFDDGWGWNSDEAKLEEEHQNSGLNKIRVLESDLNRISSEKEELEQEVKLLKVKCSKLVTKVKELKTLGEQKKSATGFEDLNFAMQEELRDQVDELDKKNKELLAEVNGMKVEKERLLKRVETLTSANHQLVEMKERQDIEVQVWKRNCTELKAQVQSCDWNWSPENKPQVVMGVTDKSRQDKTMGELEEKLNCLETENEELLQIICSLRDENQANKNLLNELNSLKEENSALKEAGQNSDQLKEVHRLREMIEVENKDKQSVIATITEEKNKLEERIEELGKQLCVSQEQCRIQETQMTQNIQDNQQIDTLSADLQAKTEQLSILNENIECLRDAVRELNDENEQIKTEKSELESENLHLKEQLSKLEEAVKEIESLQGEQNQLASEINRLTSVVQRLTDENIELKTSYESGLAELELLKADMKMTEASKESALTDLQAMKEELERVKSETNKNKTDAPPASSLFGDTSSFFNMSTGSKGGVLNSLFGTNSEEPSVEQSSTKASSSPVEILQKEVDHSTSAQSPPVFRGFFSDQADAFASVIQQNLMSDQEPALIKAVVVSDLKSSPQDIASGESITKLNDEINSLHQKVTLLEQTNSNLAQQLAESQQSVLNDNNGLSIQLNEKINHINSLQNQIDHLNEQMSVITNRFHTEREELSRLNQELERKVQEYDKIVEVERIEVNRLKCQVDELRRNEVSLVEKSGDLSALQREMDERLRQADLNFQNILLNKDEENAHLVCELSASQAASAKLSSQVEAFTAQLEAANRDVKLSREEKESLSTELIALKQNIEHLKSDNSQLSQANEGQLQMYIAQVDYLQMSVQEKDIAIAALNAEIASLNAQIISISEQAKAATERENYLDSCYSNLNASHNDLSNECTTLRDRLNTALCDVQRLNDSISSLNYELNEHRTSNESSRAKEISSIQEIEVLQCAITEKDLEIERLSKLLTGVQERLIKAEESKATDEVIKIRSRLDEALYTLHLRDVRCDELTAEIMRLLEERDSLQLRLSEALRSNESMRLSSTEPNLQPTVSQSPLVKSSSSSQDLNNKIVELHTGYMKDPAVQLDLQNRHSQQMHLFTSNESAATPAGVQVKDNKVEANKLPETSNSEYGLFNWFFSSSTPPQPTHDTAT